MSETADEATLKFYGEEAEGYAEQTGRALASSSSGPPYRSRRDLMKVAQYEVLGW
jgi:hypothetical protein